MFALSTASIAAQLTRVPRVREVESSNHKGQPNLTQRCKQLAIPLQHLRK